jgi:hypothetical protein
MATQRQQWQRSNGNGNGGAAMGVAVVVAVQQWGWQWWWRRSDGGAAMVEAMQQWWWTEAIVEYHRIVSYSVFVYQIDILRSFLRRPHTDRFPDDILKKLRRNSNPDSCEKNATGTENAGIWRIPAGICNLACRLGHKTRGLS